MKARPDRRFGEERATHACSYMHPLQNARERQPYVISIAIVTRLSRSRPPLTRSAAAVRSQRCPRQIR